MFKIFKQLFNRSNKDLRKRIYFTLFCLAIFACGTTITVSWISSAYEEYGFLEIYNLMAGGGLKSFSILISVFISPRIIFSRVDFPEPFGPSITLTLLFIILTEVSSKIIFSLKLKVMLFALII